MACAWLIIWIAAQGSSFAEWDELDEIRTQLTEVEQLITAVDSVREWNRDGLNARIDGLTITTMQRLNSLAEELLARPELSAAQRAELVEMLDRFAVLALQREQTLEQRAAAERSLFAKFQQSAQADIARVFIQDLTNLRKDYFELVVDQAEIRAATGLEPAPLLQEVRARLALIMARVIGQVHLDAMSLDQLRAQVRDDPLDEDLENAFQMVQAKQERNLHNLERALDIAERLGIDTDEQRSLLIRERGQIGVEILQGHVFATLWHDQFDQLRETLVRNGPNALFRLLLFSLVIVLAWAAARFVRYPVRALVHRNSLGLSLLLRETLVSVSSILVFIIGVALALGALGVSLGPIFAGLGVIGILVGIAVQDSLGNLAAGAMILIYRPYDVDDHIQVAGAEGVVKRMNLLATTVTTFDNQVLVVPNRRIWGDTIINFTASHVRRVDVKVTFAYGEDPDRVHAVLMDVLKQHENVLDKPEPQVHMIGMEDSAVAMVVKPWVRTEDYWATLWDLNLKIKKRLDAEGIEIPFPQRVVTLVAPEEQRRIADAD